MVSRPLQKKKPVQTKVNKDDEYLSTNTDIWFLNQDAGSGEWIFLHNASVRELPANRGLLSFIAAANNVVDDFLRTYSKPIRNTRIALDRVYPGDTDLNVSSRILDVSVSVYSSLGSSLVTCQFKVLSSSAFWGSSTNWERKKPVSPVDVWDHYRNLVLNVDTSKKETA